MGELILWDQLVQECFEEIAFQRSMFFNEMFWGSPFGPHPHESSEWKPKFNGFDAIMKGSK